jgi:AcrR family transcriptional regulator
MVTMARPVDPTIRARLAEAAAQYVLSKGIVDLSLRPLAKALKTNARMLIYHFGSREGLMREILEVIRRWGDARVSAWYDDHEKPPTLSEFLLWLSQMFTTEQLRQIALLTVELQALALRDPKAYPGVLTAPIAYWQTLSRKSGTAAKTDAAEATLMLAATRGFLIDLAATGDRRRIRRAVDLLAGMLKERGR